MHILFEAQDRKKGMTLGELIENAEKAKRLVNDVAQEEQRVKARINLNGTIQSFEIDA